MHTVGLPRTCLGFTNILFFLIGCIIFVICLWCAVNTEFFKDVNYTVTKSDLVAVIADFVNLRLWWTPLTSILIPIAAIAMMTSCCGILGAGCKIQCAIKSYIFLVTALSLTFAWIFFITGVYNVYTNNSKTREYLQFTIHNAYGRKNDLITYFWDYVMVNYGCCGAVNYKDFAESNWRKVNKDRLHPVQCCKLRDADKLAAFSENCTKSVDPNIQSHINFGCIDALRDAIESNKGMLIFYFILLTCVYSVVILFSYCIVKGEPLLGAMAGNFTSLLPSMTPKTPKDVDMTPSHASLQNMRLVKEPPQKIVKVVSAVNPFQVYELQPNAYGGRGDTFHSNSMRGLV